MTGGRSPRREKRGARLDLGPPRLFAVGFPRRLLRLGIAALATLIKDALGLVHHEDAEGLVLGRREEGL